MDEQTQKEIAEGLMSGCREAWLRLYDAYAQRVWRDVARLTGGDTACVADIVQETFLAAAAQQDRFFVNLAPGGANATLPFGDPQTPAPPQDHLSANLTPGGDFPKTPVEVYALKATNAQGVTYTGRHLAWTKRDGECIEWGLYVPDGPPPAGILGFNLLTRMNPSSPPDVKTSISINVQAPVRIEAGNFDDLVTAAMAELNDGGAAPADVSFKSVTQLAQQIRASLGNP